MRAVEAATVAGSEWPTMVELEAEFQALRADRDRFDRAMAASNDIRDDLWLWRCGTIGDVVLADRLMAKLQNRICPVDHLLTALARPTEAEGRTAERKPRRWEEDRADVIVFLQERADMLRNGELPDEWDGESVADLIANELVAASTAIQDGEHVGAATGSSTPSDTRGERR